MPLLKAKKSGDPVKKKIDISSLKSMTESEIPKLGKDKKEEKPISIRPEIEKEKKIDVSASPSSDGISIDVSKTIRGNKSEVSGSASKDVSGGPIRYNTSARYSADSGASAGLGYDSEKRISADYTSPKGASFSANYKKDGDIGASYTSKKGGEVSARYDPSTKSGGASYKSAKGRSYSADVDSENKSIRLGYGTASGGNFSVSGSLGDDKNISAGYTSKGGNVYKGSYNPKDKSVIFGAILNIKKRKK